MASLRKRTYPSGKTTWVIDYRENGKLKLHTIGDVDKAAAKKAYHKFCAQLSGQGTGEPITGEKRRYKKPTYADQTETNIAPVTEKPVQSYHKLRELEKEYLIYSRANKARGTCILIEAAFWKFYMFSDNLPLDKFDFRHIERYKARRLETVVPATINIELRALKAGFEYAVKIDWILKNPFKGVKQVPEIEKDYPVYLSIEEIQRLLEAIPDEAFRRLVRFYLLTGCRRTEAALLDWKDINLNFRTIIIRSRSTKTKKNRVIHMGEKLLNLIQEIGPKSQGRIFPNWAPDSITILFWRYCKLCNFGRKISVHSLRHTATVHWLLAGIDMYTISKILGHTSVKVTETVYAHIPAAHKQEAMDKLPY
jgi:integrase